MSENEELTFEIPLEDCFSMQLKEALFKSNNTCAIQPLTISNSIGPGAKRFPRTQGWLIAIATGRDREKTKATIQLGPTFRKGGPNPRTVIKLDSEIG